MNEEPYLFETLHGLVSEETMKAIEETGFKTMTEIQGKSIMKLLEGKDLRGTAKTGSGKTLAFLIPAIELVVQDEFKPEDGTGVIILSPTRELSMQIFSVLKDLMKYHSQSYGILMGGANRNEESKNLLSGLNVIVATPGRLLDHLKSTPHFVYKNLSCLVIDEADRLLDMGFEIQMKQILERLPKKKQTMLFSATKSQGVDDLANLSLNSNLVEVDITRDKAEATTQGLKQSYIICPDEKRFLVLHSFLKKYNQEKKKVMVFFRTCKSVSFFDQILQILEVPVKCIHGKLSQNKRTSIFFEFNKAESGVLLCTDVAARGWDIPAVDWIVQFDPPQDPIDYIHRVGRTARAGKQGEALIFLTVNQVAFIDYLKRKKVHVDRMEIPWNEVTDVQAQFEEVILKSPPLQKVATKACKHYVQSFNEKKYIHIFRPCELDMIKVGKCFGLANPPVMKGQSMHQKMKKRRMKQNQQRFKFQRTC